MIMHDKVVHQLLVQIGWFVLRYNSVGVVFNNYEVHGKSDNIYVYRAPRTKKRLTLGCYRLSAEMWTDIPL